MTTEEFIRSRAAMNWSRRMVADALGIEYRKFIRMVAEHMPDVQWSKPQTTEDIRRAHIQRRGVCTPDMHRAADIGRQARYDRAVKHRIGGFVGTTKEAFDYWQEHISVSHSQVRRRLKAGVNTLDAFFKPNETPKGWGQNRELFKSECDRIFSRAVR